MIHSRAQHSSNTFVVARFNGAMQRSPAQDRMNAVTTNDSRHGASYRRLLQHLSLPLLAVVLHTAPVLAVDPPFVFRDVASDVGLREPLRGMMAHAAAWGDVNGDGWIDLFVGTYADRPAASYVAGGAEGPVPNRLLINRNGRSTHSEQPAVAWLGRASGVVLADLDNDGWPDLYAAVVTMRGANVYPAVYRNLGLSAGRSPKFQETAFVRRQDFPGPEDYIPGERSASFYQRLVANRKVMYFAPGPSGDFDNDGRLDLFLPSWWPNLPSMLLRNETPAGHYLDVFVIGSGKINRMGIGSEVRAYRAGEAGKADALLAWEQIATGYGFCSAQPPVAHLGLGDTTVCDLVITLPHGRGKIVRENVQADQPLTIQVE